MNPSEDDVRAGIAWIKSLTLLHEDTVIRPAAMSYVKPSEYRRWVELRLDDVLALLDAARKDRELLAGVQRVEMDMREDGERVCWDGVAGTFCFSDGTCHAESIAAMGLDIMRRDP